MVLRCIIVDLRYSCVYVPTVYDYAVPAPSPMQPVNTPPSGE